MLRANDEPTSTSLLATNRYEPAGNKVEVLTMFTTVRASMMVSVALMATACMPKTSMRILEPASVDVPADIQVIGIVDRSSARNAGETVLGVLEGIVTGESLGADTQGRQAAMEAAVRILEESPRFEVVRVSDAQRGRTSLFDREMDHNDVRRICDQAGCDALLSLEAFDSDTRMQINGVTVNTLTNPEALKRRIADLDVSDVRATSDTTVMASWRMYDADQDRVVDELRDRERTWNWQGSGSLVDVRRAMPMAGSAVGRAGAGVGAEYASRIAPSWQWVQRRYYGGGSPELRSAKRYVRAGDWDGAMRIWEDQSNNPDPKVRGRAAYNMALGSEVKGDFGGALEHAREAAVALHNGKSRRYVFTLEQRERDEARLARQMAPASEEVAPPVRQERVHPSQRDGARTVTLTEPDSTSGSTPGGTMSRPRR
ncbi:MAG: surface antigen [Myxococcota bacterium]|jgi:surface antigen